MTATVQQLHKMAPHSKPNPLFQSMTNVSIIQQTPNRLKKKKKMPSQTYFIEQQSINQHGTSCLPQMHNAAIQKHQPKIPRKGIILHLIQQKASPLFENHKHVLHPG